ncbi:hypothetical protein C4580_00880 [Candidatus Woesearchaeota archaeon]|nr:MAG: hypothetical protein C4580_00880 [Candidatus Woesearchaeota archaeon]
MRGLIIALIVLCLATGAYAVTCTDTDNGGADEKDEALKILGSVKYGITDLHDTCVTSTSTDEAVSTNKSKYLREYFCQGGQRSNEIYDCTRFGYSGCENGRCTGNASGTGGSSGSSSKPISSCGNKITEKDKGENCDPPGSICFGKTTAQYGSCQNDCTCKIAQAALENNPVVIACGDNDKDASEECEEDAHCPSGHLCSSCKCVKKLTPEEIEAMKKQAESKEETKTEPTPAKETTPPIPEIDAEPKNFSDTPAMKATSGIAGFFKSVVGWIASLFS